MSGVEELRTWCERQRDAAWDAVDATCSRGLTHCAAEARGMADAYDAVIHHIDQTRKEEQ